MTRKNIGTYPKWFAQIVKWFARFIFKTILRRRVSITQRGRGKRRELAKALCFYAGRFDQDLPIQYSKKVALYLTAERR